MDSIKEILKKRNLKQPSLMNEIKTYIKNHYNENCSVKITKKNIIIYVHSSSLANTIRINQIKISQELDIINQKIIVQIQ